MKMVTGEIIVLDIRKKENTSSHSSREKINVIEPWHTSQTEGSALTLAPLF
jgi:hypothetical protein